ncbi:cache domain-containing sensor histidine kinase [Paenibacillus arenilitoris]|uniref:Histidine kinase n=1 Tax=Paenibacillus arenilitoris TaxID=2772299 RepID=A0A927CHJ5_9BACL|nr:sensor histidine kinase [Paenibacillus arenilitoris]MBD2867645.1 histidine kinase [Paenibacillus arenilitoris]
MTVINPLFRKRFQNSLRSRLIATFSLLLVVVLGSFLIFTNLLVIKPLKQKTINETLLSTAKIADRLDDYIAVQNQLSQRILSNRAIFSFGALSKQPAQGVAALNQNRVLSNIMFQAAGPSLNIRDIIIYDLQGREVASYIGYVEPPSLELLLRDPETVRSLQDSSYMIHAGHNQPVSFIRSIIDINGTVYGYLSIQLDDNDLIKLADIGNFGSTYVKDGRGGLVIQSRNADYGKHAASLRDVSEAQGIYKDAEDNYIAYHASEHTGWTVYAVIPGKSVLGSVNSVTNIAVILIVSLTLFSYLYIHFMSKNLVLPIRKLRSQILNLSYSNLSLRADSRLYNNEFHLFNEAFRELLERLQTSIEREKLALHEEVMARNSALQAQIAPHFIHNVLYLISIAAQENKMAVVTQMCKHLSESLRYIVSSPYQHVTLRDEIEHTKHYLSLIKHKYEEDLEWDIDMDPAGETILLPRLVIQPFVENCIEHAFDRTDPPWRISIKIKLYSGLWAIEISDNGAGFAEESMRSIMQKIGEGGSAAQPTKIGSMGIANTVGRLELMYRNRLFFNMFNNAETGGATIQIIASLTKDFY